MLSVERVRVREWIKSDYAVASDDGHFLRSVIRRILNEGKTALLDFDGLQTITASFLMPAIGELYREYPPPVVESGIRIANESPGSVIQVRQVMRRSRAHWHQRTPGDMEAIINANIEDLYA